MENINKILFKIKRKIKCILGFHNWIESRDVGDFFDYCQPYCNHCGVLKYEKR